MKIFITGGSGFLGKHILDYLIPEDHDILAATLSTPLNALRQSRNLKWITVDLSNIQSYRREIINFNPEVVIHLAWQGIPDYSFLTSSTNLINSLSLVNMLVDNTQCRHFIVAGSCMEYSKGVDYCREDGPTEKGNYFSWAKSSLREYFSLLSKSNAIDVTWLRIFYVYGIGQRSEALIPSLVRSLRSGISPAIKCPDNFNDFIYVKDVAKLFELCVNSRSAKSGIFNVGTGTLHSVREVAQLVELNLTGETKIIDNLQLQKQNYDREIVSDIFPYRADPTKAEQVFDWHAEWSLAKGIKSYCDELELMECL